jgi:hypothetical protein
VTPASKTTAKKKKKRAKKKSAAPAPEVPDTIRVRPAYLQMVWSSSSSRMRATPMASESDHRAEYSPICTIPREPGRNVAREHLARHPRSALASSNFRQHSTDTQHVGYIPLHWATVEDAKTAKNERSM